MLPAEVEDMSDGLPRKIRRSYGKRRVVASREPSAGAKGARSAQAC